MNALIAECPAVLSVEALAQKLAADELNMLALLRDRERARLRANAYVLIRRLLNLTPEAGRIFYDSDGRPRMRGASVDISISHKADRVAVGVVGCPGRIGIDLEDLDEPIDADVFGRFALSEGERAHVAHMAEQGWCERRATIAYWSAKESFCKCTGYPFRPMDLRLRWSPDFQVAGVDAEPRLNDFLRSHELRPTGTAVSADGRWVLSVTLSEPNWSPPPGRGARRAPSGLGAYESQ